MGRRSVRREEVPALLEELAERGARSVRRHPADLGGRVEVTWESGALELEEPRGREEAWAAHGMAVGLGFMVLVAVLALLFVS